MEVYKKLLEIQSELKAPKGQKNTFGNYSYRSCEDILEAVKPLLKKHNCALVIGDGIEHIGERYYVHAEASIIDAETGDRLSNRAYAREEENKKGMDGSQITGASSSYARKYALNGLFAIDDTKDADTDGFRKQTNGPTNAEQAADSKKADKINEGFNPDDVEMATEEQIEAIKAAAKEAKVNIITALKAKKRQSLHDLTYVEANGFLDLLNSKAGAV